MHVVIMGCGRVGSELAARLESGEHTVSVIDKNPTAFRMLRYQFKGKKIEGYGFDEDILRDAGIERAGAFAAVSSGDNSNIIAARVARETFGVQNVVARIYDPGRAEVYQRLGIPTVATVRWTADQMLRRLLPAADDEWNDPSGKVSVAQLDLAPSWVGKRYASLEHATGARVALLTRLGEGLVPGRETVVQEGDLVHLTVAFSDLRRVERLLGFEPVLEED